MRRLSPATAVLSVTTGVSLIAARGSGSVLRKKYHPATPRPITTTTPRTSHFQIRRMRTLQTGPVRLRAGFPKGLDRLSGRSQVARMPSTAGSRAGRILWSMRRSALPLRHRNFVAGADSGARLQPSTSAHHRSRAVFRCRNETLRGQTPVSSPDRDHRRGRHRPRGRGRGHEVRRRRRRRLRRGARSTWAARATSATAWCWSRSTSTPSVGSTR